MRKESDLNQTMYPIKYKAQHAPCYETVMCVVVKKGEHMKRQKKRSNLTRVTSRADETKSMKALRHFILNIFKRQL